METHLLILLSFLQIIYRLSTDYFQIMSDYLQIIYRLFSDYVRLFTGYLQIIFRYTELPSRTGV